MAEFCLLVLSQLIYDIPFLNWSFFNFKPLKESEKFKLITGLLFQNCKPDESIFRFWRISPYMKDVPILLLQLTLFTVFRRLFRSFYPQNLSFFCFYIDKRCSQSDTSASFVSLPEVSCSCSRYEGFLSPNSTSLKSFFNYLFADLNNRSIRVDYIFFLYFLMTGGLFTILLMYSSLSP